MQALEASHDSSRVGLLGPKTDYKETDTSDEDHPPCLVQEFPSIDHMLAAWKQDPLGSKEQREEQQQMGYNAPAGPPGRPSGWGELPQQLSAHYSLCYFYYLLFTMLLSSSRSTGRVGWAATDVEV